MFARGVRGAITLESNTKEEVKKAVIELLNKMLEENKIDTKDIAFAIFTSVYVVKLVVCLATIGYAIAGYGISPLAPILYSKANKAKAMPAASAVTFVGSMGFLGYFMGPPMIGHIAHATSLSLSLGVFAVLILLCLFLRLDND